MPQNVSNAELRSLVEWWDAMGVPTDAAELRRIVESGTTTTHTASAPEPTSPNPTRAIKSNALEDRVAEAEGLARAAGSFPALKAAIEAFDGCPLKKLCERTVVYDGTEGAPVMVIGEGPGGQEDRLGLPFVGKAGQLLDKMLAAISLDRKQNAFITNVNYWRPPGNRNPEAEELAVCRPFVDRMIDLGAPRLILVMGGVAAKTLLNTQTGIMKLRGTEQVYQTPGGTSAPLIPLFHPAYLLRRPQDKAKTWQDLLLAKSRLSEMGIAL